MSPAELSQRHASLELANAKRAAVVEHGRRIAAEPGYLRTVLENPPAELEDMAIVDVLRLARCNRRRSAAEQRMGRLAVEAGVNLMLPLGRASLVTRRWVARNAEWNWKASKR